MALTAPMRSSLNSEEAPLSARTDLSLYSLGIQSYLLRYGDWRECDVGARRVQSYLLREYLDP